MEYAPQTNSPRATAKSPTWLPGAPLTYAELAEGKTLAHDLPDDDPITPPTEWTVAGKSVGKNRRPRFRYRSASIHARSASRRICCTEKFCARHIRRKTCLARWHRALSHAGVVAVRDGDFVGVAAPTERSAEKALAAIHAEWKEHAADQQRELFSYLKENPDTEEERSQAAPAGSVADGFARRRAPPRTNLHRRVHRARSARAARRRRRMVRRQLTVWTGSQRPFGVRDELAAALHLPKDRVRVIVPDTGSAYGGKHTGDAALEAARLARAANRPVKVVWTREEEFTWAYFRPAGVIEIKSAINADGKLTAWEFHNYNSGGSGIQTPYDVANQLHPISSGTIRRCARAPIADSPPPPITSRANPHMDELAHAAQIDPLEFRLKNLSDLRLRAVFEAAAKSFGWPQKKTQSGQGFGLGGGVEKDGYVATCAEISADQTSGEVRVVRVVTAFECGAIVNPDGLRNQVIGANIMGLGGALFESIEFENGQISNPHLAQYRVPRFRDIPLIEAVLLDRKDIPPAGAGETPIVGLAPAIGNAIFDATGIRLRHLPMVPGGLNNLKISA